MNWFPSREPRGGAGEAQRARCSPDGSISHHRDRKRRESPCFHLSCLLDEKRAGLWGKTEAVVSESPEEERLGKVVTEHRTGNPDTGSCLLLPSEKLGIRGVGGASQQLQRPGLGVCPSGLARWQCQEYGRLLRGVSSLLTPQGFLFPAYWLCPESF